MSASEILRSSTERMAWPMRAAYDHVGFRYEPSGPTRDGAVSARLRGARFRVYDSTTLAAALAPALAGWRDDEANVKLEAEGPGLERWSRGGGPAEECWEVGEEEGGP